MPVPIGRRPVVLLSRTPVYDYLNKVIVAEITTTILGIPQEVEVGKKQGLIRRPCGERPAWTDLLFEDGSFSLRE